MLWLVLGGLVLFVFLGGLRAFERASVTTIKSLLAWVAALGGLTLALLLLLTGRGGIAIGALVMFGPLIWQRWRAANPGAMPFTRPNPNAGPGPDPNATSARRFGPMTIDEAYQVLGLKAGASEPEIRAAHRRLMRSAHPDSGGSDWLAARVNQARDVLLNTTRRT